MRSFGIAGAQASAGIEERKVRRCRVPLWQADLVPPGNAVLGEDDGGVLAEAAAWAGDQSRHAVAFSVLITTSCGPSCGRIVGAFTLAEVLAADAQCEAIVPDRRQMRSRASRTNRHAGARQPDRKMAADGARAENTDAHDRCPCVPKQRQFPVRARRRKPPCDGRDRAHAGKIWIGMRSSAIVARQTTTRGIADDCQPRAVDPRRARGRDRHPEPAGGQQRL